MKLEKLLNFLKSEGKGSYCYVDDDGRNITIDGYVKKKELNEFLEGDRK